MKSNSPRILSALAVSIVAIWAGTGCGSESDDVALVPDTATPEADATLHVASHDSDGESAEVRDATMAGENHISARTTTPVTSTAQSEFEAPSVQANDEYSLEPEGVGNVPGTSEAGEGAPPLHEKVGATPNEEMAAADAPLEVSVAAIESAPGWFEWYELREAYQERGTTNADIEIALSAKESQLTETTPLKRFGEAVEVVDYKWERVEPPLTRENEVRYRFSWLVRKATNLKIPDGRQTVLILKGRVDKMHEHLVPRLRGEPEIEQRAVVDLESWDQGSLHAVDVELWAAELPYSLISWLSIEDPPGTEDRKYDRYGTVIQLGWHADLD